MSKWSSFEKQQLLTENWRKYLNEEEIDEGFADRLKQAAKGAYKGGKEAWEKSRPKVMSDYPATEIATIVKTISDLGKKANIPVDTAKIVDEFEEMLKAQNFVIKEQKLELGADLKLDLGKAPTLKAFMVDLAKKDKSLLTPLMRALSNGSFNVGEEYKSSASTPAAVGPKINRQRKLYVPPAAEEPSEKPTSKTNFDKETGVPTAKTTDSEPAFGAQAGADLSKVFKSKNDDETEEPAAEEPPSSPAAEEPSPPEEPPAPRAKKNSSQIVMDSIRSAYRNAYPDNSFEKDFKEFVRAVAALKAGQSLASLKEAGIPTLKKGEHGITNQSLQKIQDSELEGAKRILLAIKKAIIRGDELRSFRASFVKMIKTTEAAGKAVKTPAKKAEKAKPKKVQKKPQPVAKKAKSEPVRSKKKSNDKKEKESFEKIKIFPNDEIRNKILQRNEAAFRAGDQGKEAMVTQVRGVPKLRIGTDSYELSDMQLAKDTGYRMLGDSKKHRQTLKQEIRSYLFGLQMWIKKQENKEQK
jgi:hypothetical protein